MSLDGGNGRTSLATQSPIQGKEGATKAESRKCHTRERGNVILERERDMLRGGVTYKFELSLIDFRGEFLPRSYIDLSFREEF